jgi:hypothetical protein
MLDDLERLRATPVEEVMTRWVVTATPGRRFRPS